MVNFKRILAKTLIKIAEVMARYECIGAAAYDIVDIRDHEAPTLYKLKGLPEEFDLKNKVGQLGWNRHIQHGAECTTFSKIHQEEYKNSIWNNKLVELSTERQWSNQLRTGASQTKGDSLLNSQKQFALDPQGYPVPGYFRIRATGDELIEQIKLHIYLRFTPPQTGLKWRTKDGKSNYYELKRTGIYDPMLGGKVDGAHAVAVRGWNKIGLLIQDSLNNTYGDNTEDGVFTVPYKYVGTLFNMYLTKDLKD